jgi:hypothetical protein
MGGVDADHLEEVARDERARDPAPVETAVDIGHDPVGVGENADFTPECVELRAGEMLALAVGGSPPVHREHFVHVGNRIDAKQQRAEYRERHGDQAQPEPDGRDDGERHDGRTLESAERIEDVANRVIDEGGTALVAALVGSERHGPEACARLGAGLGRGHASRDELLRLPFDVEGELFVELAFDAASHEQRARAQLPVAEVHRLRQLHDAANRGGHALPRARLGGQLPAPGSGELVILRPPAKLGHRPLGGDPALMLEAMEGGVERPLVDLQDVSGDLLDALRDRPAMKRLGLKRSQDQQVERAGQQVGYELSRHWCR